MFPGQVGGSENYLRGLLGAFESGHGPERLTVLANRLLPEGYAPEMARLSYRPGRSSATRLLAMTSGMALPASLPAGLDLVHYPLTVPVPRTRLPRVVTLHDLQHLELPEFFSRGERLFRRRAYEGAARSADAVVTPSAHARDLLVERTGVPADRIEVAPHGIDHQRFRPDGPGDERALAGLPLPERFLLYPANMWPHKNHRRLVEALAAAADREIALVLIGNPYGKLDELLALAARSGVGPRVAHLGFVEGAAVPALMRRARGMIFPSLFEGFGQPPLEAMACGCPVASSVRGALAEVCAGAALELDPESVDSIAAAIDRLASDDELAARLRAAGLQRAAGYSWERSAERHLAAYAQAVGRRSGR